MRNYYITPKHASMNHASDIKRLDYRNRDINQLHAFLLEYHQLNLQGKEDIHIG
jgi:hypothetical protein